MKYEKKDLKKLRHLPQQSSAKSKDEYLEWSQFCTPHFPLLQSASTSQSPCPMSQGASGVQQVSLPKHGQGYWLQDCDSEEDPGQLAPPYNGAGLVQDRDLDCVPPPQVTEH